MIGRLAMRAAVSGRQMGSKHQQVRRMGGGGHGHVEYTGMEKTMRHYFPEDHQVVLANLGLFAGLFGLYKLSTIGKKPAPAPAPAAAAATDAEVPSVFDESFEEFAKGPGNMEKYEKSVVEWFDKQ